MKVTNITIAQNGFVLETNHNTVYIAKTLLEAAQISGEAVPLGNTVVYAPGYGATNLQDARRFALAGQKIEAIKTLRDTFTQRLGLREAKDIIEVLCNC